MTRKLISWTSAIGLAAVLACPPVVAEPVDLELVIAIDVSSSVNEEEYLLQTRGIAAAFRNSAVLDAIATLGIGLAVAVVQWSDDKEQELLADWRVIRTETDAVRLSRTLRNAPRLIPGGQTSIAGAINFSLEQFETNGYEGSRQVIDVSGDGRANNGVHPMGSRDEAIGEGVTVNGLAILNEEPFLDGYFEHSVIGGAGAFLMVAEDYRDFAAAILQKLLREIGQPIAQAEPEIRVFASVVEGVSVLEETPQEESLRPR